MLLLDRLFHRGGSARSPGPLPAGQAKRDARSDELADAVQSLDSLARYDESGVARLVVLVCQRVLATGGSTRCTQIKRDAELSKSLKQIRGNVFHPTIFATCKECGVDCELQMDLAPDGGVTEVYTLLLPSHPHDQRQARLRAALLAQRWFPVSLGISAVAYRVSVR